MIDRDRLAELEDDFGAEDLQEIIEAFLSEAEETVTALGHSLSDEPTPERNGHLHFLKGCARNVGAVRLGDLCEQFEDANTGYSRADHQVLLAEFQAVCRFFSDGAMRLTA